MMHNDMKEQISSMNFLYDCLIWESKMKQTSDGAGLTDPKMRAIRRYLNTLEDI